MGESVTGRVVRLLDCFSAADPVLTVSQLATRSGLHVATASRLVAELERQGLVERTGDRGVRLGMRLWELGSRAQPTLLLRTLALPHLAWLQGIVGQNTQFGVRDGDEVLFLERVQAPGAVVNYTTVAGRLPLTASSSGLVLLAHADRATLARVRAQVAPSYTPHTPTDPEHIRRLLAHVRREGYALCRGFLHADAAGLAAPVRDADGGVVAAVSVIVPNDAGATRHVGVLLEAARRIDATLAEHGFSHSART